MKKLLCLQLIKVTFNLDNMVRGKIGKCPHPLFQLSYNGKRCDVLRTVLATVKKNKDIKGFGSVSFTLRPPISPKATCFYGELTIYYLPKTSLQLIQESTEHNINNNVTKNRHLPFPNNGLHAGNSTTHCSIIS